MRRIVLPSAGRDHLLLPGMFVSGRRGLSHHTTDASGDRTEDEIEPTELTEIVKTPVGRPRRAQKRFEPAGQNRKTIRAGRPEPTNDSSRPAGAEKRFESGRSVDHVHVQRPDAATGCGTGHPPPRYNNYLKPEGNTRGHVRLASNHGQAKDTRCGA